MKKDIVVPELGGASQVTVVDVWVKKGQSISKDAPLVTVESEKASMELPSEYSGCVLELFVEPGDVVKEGDVIASMQCALGQDEVLNHTNVDDPKQLEVSFPQSTTEETPKKPTKKAPTKEQQRSPEPLESVAASYESVYAGPSVRRLARELEVDLTKLKGTGPKARITRDDIVRYVRTAMQSADLPKVDWEDPSLFGPVTMVDLPKIKRITAKRLGASWWNSPLVTQFDKCEVDCLEKLRQEKKAAFKQHGIRLTLLAFILKALARSLEAFPNVNSAYDAQSEVLHQRSYVHLGVAVDTPSGLVVPVVRNVNQLSIRQISSCLQEVSEKARQGKLLPREMMGASMTVSSLGGIGGEYFTPLLNPPQVAILGVGRSKKEPVWTDQGVEGRLLLPLSLSYDHRVIDGADGMRFLNAFMEQMRLLEHEALDIN